MSVTQLVYKELLGMPVFTADKIGENEKCWLCGGDTENQGWRLKDVVTSAFTDGSLAKSPTSGTICYSCTALMKKEAWELACEKHGHSPYFPVKDGKKPCLSNWMFSSHVFSKDGWLRPERSEIADVLLNPPKPPFVITLAEVGKKHVIFKSQVSHSIDDYFVNIDEQTIQVNRQIFTNLLDIVERAYVHFSKDSILTGEYNQKAIMQAGLGVWREFESQLKVYRSKNKDLLKLACFVARKESK